MTLAACTLLIAAASDLAPLQNVLAKAVPGCSVEFSFASSGTLARQIRHGAEFDLFLAASRSYLEQLGAEVMSPTPYALGRLAVWSRKGLKWKDLNSAREIAIANPVHAPYGLAARQAMERQGLWPAIQEKVVYAENVRQALQFAATANADVALVAWSLVHKDAGQLLPASWHDPIVQTAAIPRRSRNPEAARRFLAWLTSEAGQRALVAGGFDRLQVQGR
jgi:molybdate transport system substrate-binding protein